MKLFVNNNRDICRRFFYHYLKISSASIGINYVVCCKKKTEIRYKWT